MRVAFTRFGDNRYPDCGKSINRDFDWINKHRFLCSWLMTSSCHKDKVGRLIVGSERKQARKCMIKEGDGGFLIGR